MLEFNYVNSGTGKTYIGLRIVETLLANTNKFPILVVCYTNHALDQFLEGIARFCEKNKLIRIGGKSQSEALQKFNLSHIKSEMRLKREVPTYIHNGRFETVNAIKQYQSEISLLEEEIESLKERIVGFKLRDVISSCNPNHLLQLTRDSNVFSLEKSILNWLGMQIKDKRDENGNEDVQQDNIDRLDTAPELDDELLFDEEEINEIERSRLIDYDSDDGEERHSPALRFERPRDQIEYVMINSNDFDEDGFQFVQGKNRGFKNHFKREMTKTQAMPDEQARLIRNIYTLSSNARWDLYRLWIKLYAGKLGDEIKKNRDLYRNECIRFNGIRNQEDVEAVRDAKIIGMTTTGAAKYRHIIAAVKPKITSKCISFLFLPKTK